MLVPKKKKNSSKSRQLSPTFALFSNELTATLIRIVLVRAPVCLSLDWNNRNFPSLIKTSFSEFYGATVLSHLSCSLRPRWG